MADKKVLRIFTGEEDDQWDLKKIFLIVVIGLCVVGAILSSVTNKKNKDNNK